MDDFKVRESVKAYDRPNLGSAIFIGLGGTGLEVLKRMRKMIENDKTSLASESEKPFRFLLLDTDERTASEIQDSGIDFLFLGGFSPREYVENQYNEISNWFWRENERPWLRSLPRVKIGADQIRLMGRLAFYLHRNEFKTVIDNYVIGLTNFLNALKKQNTAGSTISIDTFIVGSLAGGTGSSMFNDVAAAVHYVMEDKGYFEPQVTGIFLTADVFLQKINEEFLKYRVKANTFGAFAEYFYDKGASIKNRTLKPRLNPLADGNKEKIIDTNNFTNFIVIQDTNENGRTAEINDLYEFVASSLYTMASIYGRVASTGANIKGIGSIVYQERLPDVLSSMGAYSIYYPKEIVLDYATDVILSKLIPAYFYNNSHNAHEPEEKTVDVEIENLLDSLDLNYAVKNNKGKANSTLIKGLTSEIKEQEDNLHNNPVALMKVFNNPNLRTAEDKFDEMIKEGEKKVAKYKEQLEALFKENVDQMGNKVSSLVDKKIETIKSNLNATYKNKDFGYLDTFMLALKNKLKTIYDILNNEKAKKETIVHSENQGPSAVKSAISQFNGKFFSNRKKLSYLKKHGVTILDVYYKAMADALTFEYAAKLIYAIYSSVEKEFNTLRDFELAMQEVYENIVKPQKDGFIKRFDETQRVTPSKQSILNAIEIEAIVNKNLDTTLNNNMMVRSYQSIAENLYEEFRKQYDTQDAGSNERSKDKLKKWVKGAIIENARNFYANTFSKLVNLSIYDALRELYDEKTTTKLLEERVAKFKDVPPFVRLDPVKLNKNLISIRNFLFLPPDRDDNNNIDPYWKNIAAKILGTINGKGNVTYLPSPNRQVLTFIRLIGGIGPLSLVTWNNYDLSYRRVVDGEDNSYKREENRVPVLADRRVESAIENVAVLMKSGKIKSALIKDSLLENIAIGYVLGNIIEKPDLRCSIKMLNKLNDDYWDKYVKQLPDQGDGVTYYEFVPPSNYGSNLYTLHNYLKSLSSNSKILAELSSINQSIQNKIHPEEFVDRVKETIKVLDKKIKSSQIVGGGLPDLIEEYKEIKEFLEDRVD